MNREQVNKLVEDQIRRHVESGRLVAGRGWLVVPPFNYVDENHEYVIQHNERVKQFWKTFLTVVVYGAVVVMWVAKCLGHG